MKKQILTLTFALCAAFGYSQTNTFPTSGSVGIGTATPSTTVKLDVVSSGSFFVGGIKLAYFGTRNTAGDVGTGIYLGTKQLSYPSGNFNVITSCSSITSAVGTTNAAFIDFNAPITSNTTAAAFRFGYGTQEFVRINQDGKVRIGSNNRATPAGYRLFVEEGILTEKVKVAVSTLGDWADYVFAPDYKLMPLKDVEQFTKENKHLPNVPSASEMVNNGLDVAEMDAKLLEKVEELTLYLIEQNKQIELLKAEITSLKEQKK